MRAGGCAGSPDENDEVWRGHRNGTELDFLIRSDNLDSESTTGSGHGPRQCASNNKTYRGVHTQSYSRK
eukprot:1394070-Prymnesium_polylepis.1